MSGRNPAAPRNQPHNSEQNDADRDVETAPDGGSPMALVSVRDRLDELEARVTDIEVDVASLWDRSGEFRCVACGTRFFVEDAAAVHRSYGLVGGSGPVRGVECPVCQRKNTVDKVGMTEELLTAKADAAREHGDAPTEKDAKTGEIKSDNERVNS